MKKNYILLALVMVAITAMQACTPKEESQINQEKIVSAKGILDQPVKYELAEACLKHYGTTVTTQNISRTDYIAFDKANLNKWLKELDSITTYDSMRVCLGLYTKEILKEYRKPANLENRLTVFLFPYKAGKPAIKGKDASLKEEEKIEPYNMGEVHP